MQEELITFETAVLAKEKGFDEPCWEAYGVYSQFGELKGNECLQTSFENEFGGTFDQQDYDRDTFYLAPTQSLLQKWLREVHNIHIIIKPSGIRSYECIVYNDSKNYPTVFEISESGNFKSYEDALEAGLQEVLNII